ncbi:MAG: YifB family Mg chelatase-like AAA ATPase [Verrucomicrobiota bacterium]
MLAKVTAATIVGIEALSVEVEVDVGLGLSHVVVVGLPDAAVKESRDRVKSAITNSGFFHPERRITVNLAPATIKKEGPLFDLPIALGMLAASEQLSSQCLRDFLIVGELALDGSLRPVRGILPLAEAAKSQKARGILVPQENAKEASVISKTKVYGIRTLQDAVNFLEGKLSLAPTQPQSQAISDSDDLELDIDFSDVKGQEAAKRALEIAAAGGHNILMLGDPGSGKSMLAKRIPTILPPLTHEESIETTKIHSICGLIKTDAPLIKQRPFRSPHHTISDIGLIGGSVNPSPGEVSLAHHGVLFMDELPEFKRSTLEVLRQPLEDGQVTISRASGTLTFPSRFMFVAAMNPTPTGSKHDTSLGRISHQVVQKYLSKISGPLLDRIDIHLEVPSLKLNQLLDAKPSEPSRVIRQRVIQARERQLKRLASKKSHQKSSWCNAQMSSKDIKKWIHLDRECQELLKFAMKDLQLSARAYDRILKVSLTIADLEACDSISPDHLSEAIQYRTLDRQLWGQE